MKIHHLAFDNDDFVFDDNRFESPVVDLYDNDMYRAYSTTKSAYGTNLLGDGTWTGLDELSPTETEVGYVDGGRFIDTSAKLNLINAVMEGALPEGWGGLSYTIQVHVSDIPDHPEDWPEEGSFGPHDDFLLFSTPRYVRFIVTVDNPDELDIESHPGLFRMRVRVEVGKPVVDPFYQRAKLALNKLPEWMEMREIDADLIAEPLSRPMSVGGKFVNLTMGEWLDKISADLRYISMQSYIDTLDTNQVAWVHKYQMGDTTWFSRVHDDSGLEIPQATDLGEFYNAAEDEDIYLWSEAVGVIFTRKRYDNITLFQGQSAVALEESSLHHVWNSLDDIGLTFDLPRHHGEDNETYKLRILDVSINKSGSGVESFQTAIRRELNLWKSEGLDVDSEYDGALPEVLEVDDLKTDTHYMGDDGLPKRRFKDLVTKLAKDYPTTWGNFYWGDAVWNPGGEGNEGFDLLPTQFDAGRPTEVVKPGVGDFSDLLVHRPEAITGPVDFAANLDMKVKVGTLRDVYTPVDVELSITGMSYMASFVNPTVEFKITLALYIDSSKTRGVYAILDASAVSGITAETPSGTEESKWVFNPFDMMGNLSSEVNWMPIGSLPSPIGSYSVSDFDSGVIYTGQATDSSLSNFINRPTSHVGNVSVTTSSDGEVLHSNSPDALVVPGADAGFGVVMTSIMTSASSVEWMTPTTVQNITINPPPGSPEENGVQGVSVPLIEWPSHVASPGMLLVEITSVNPETGEPCGITKDKEGEDVYIPASTFTLEGGASEVPIFGWGYGIWLVAPDGVKHEGNVLVRDSFSTGPTTVNGRTTAEGGMGSDDPLLASRPWLRREGDAYPVISGGRLTGAASGTSSTFVHAELPISVNITPNEQYSIEANLERVNQNSTASSKLWVSYNLEEDSGAGLEFSQLSAGTLMAYFVTRVDGDEVDRVQLGSIPSLSKVKVTVRGLYLGITIEGMEPDSNATLDFGMREVQESMTGEYCGFSFNDERGSRIYSSVRFSDIVVRNPGYSELNEFELEIGVGDSSVYPVEMYEWTTQTYRYKDEIRGIVDENGPWRYGIRQEAPSGNYIWDRLDLKRSDFGIPDEDRYVPSKLDVTITTGGDMVDFWSDKYFVNPVSKLSGSVEHDAGLEESYDQVSGEYHLGQVNLFASLRDDIDPRWVLRVNSGHLYLGEKEYYAYANHMEEVVTSKVHRLSRVPRQGAPVIVTETDIKPLMSDSFDRPDSDDIGYSDGNGLLDPMAWDVGNDIEIKGGGLVAKEGAYSGSVAADTDFGDFKATVNVVAPITADGRPNVVVYFSNLDVGRYFNAYVLRDTMGRYQVGGQVLDYSQEVWGLESFYGYVNAEGDPLGGGVNVELVIVKLHDKFKLEANGEVIGSLNIEPGLSDQITISVETGFFVDSINIVTAQKEVEERGFTRVAFYDEESKSLSLENKETIKGNGSDTLYIAFDDTVDVTVKDVLTGYDITSQTSSSTGEVKVAEVTDPQKEYVVTYKVKDSFIVWSDKSDGEQLANLELSDIPSADKVVTVSYEGSTFDPAFSTNIPMHPSYSRITDGFIFLSEEEYDLSRVEMKATPPSLVADGNDYITLTIRTIDKNGNHKPNQSLRMGTNWGTLSNPTPSTDADGFAEVLLLSSPTMPNEDVEITVNGHTGSWKIDVQAPLPKRPEIIAAPSVQSLPADGESEVTVHARAVTYYGTYMENVDLTIRRGRSLREAFESPVIEAARTDEDGKVIFQPFTVEDSQNPGFWFCVIEDVGRTMGDVIFWREYPEGKYGIDDMTGLPLPDENSFVAVESISPYTEGYKFLVHYDENEEPFSIFPFSPEWTPPVWYNLDWYLQHQLGIISGNEEGTFKPNYVDDAHSPV